MACLGQAPIQQFPHDWLSLTSSFGGPTYSPMLHAKHQLNFLSRSRLASPKSEPFRSMVWLCDGFSHISSQLTTLCSLAAYVSSRLRHLSVQCIWCTPLLMTWKHSHKPEQDGAMSWNRMGPWATTWWCWSHFCPHIFIDSWSLLSSSLSWSSLSWSSISWSSLSLPSTHLFLCWHHKRTMCTFQSLLVHPIPSPAITCWSWPLHVLVQRTTEVSLREKEAMRILNNKATRTNI